MKGFRPWSRALEKHTIAQLVKKFMALYGYMRQAAVPIVSQVNPDHTPTSSFFKLRSVPSGVIPSGGPVKILCISHTHRVFYMRPTNTSLARSIHF